jgi:hypothetical protein
MSDDTHMKAALKSLRALLVQSRPPVRQSARDIRRDSAVLSEAADVLARRRADLPVNVDVSALHQTLVVTASALECDIVDRGAPPNSKLETLIMGLATTFDHFGERVTITRDGKADLALQSRPSGQLDASISVAPQRFSARCPLVSPAS